MRSFTKVSGRAATGVDTSINSIGSIGFGIRSTTDEKCDARCEEGGRGTRIGRYYKRGIISACGAGARRIGLRGSIYSERMVLRWCTAIIIRSYWIIALHLAIPWEQNTPVFPDGIPEKMHT